MGQLGLDLSQVLSVADLAGPWLMGFALFYLQDQSKNKGPNFTIAKKADPGVSISDTLK